MTYLLGCGKCYKSIQHALELRSEPLACMVAAGTRCTLWRKSVILTHGWGGGGRRGQCVKQEAYSRHRNSISKSTTAWKCVLSTSESVSVDKALWGGCLREGLRSALLQLLGNSCCMSLGWKMAWSPAMELKGAKYSSLSLTARPWPAQVLVSVILDREERC